MPIISKVNELADEEAWQQFAVYFDLYKMLLPLLVKVNAFLAAVYVGAPALMSSMSVGPDKAAWLFLALAFLSAAMSALHFACLRSASELYQAIEDLSMRLRFVQMPRKALLK